MQRARIVRVAALSALGLALLSVAVANVRLTGVGQTRPSSGHPHAVGATLEASTLPPVLDFVPTYHRDVRPILEKNCTSCHTDGGIAPFALNDPSSVIQHARAAQLAVQARRMPPFLPSGESPRFRDAMKLSDHEIAIIANWSWAGAPMGKPSDAVATPPPRAKPKFDLTVDIGRDFQPQSDYSDEYRCFLINPNLEKPQWLSGYNITPGNSSIVHHVVIYQVTGRFVKEARDLEARQDGRGGWPCYGGPGIGDDALRDVAYRTALAGGSGSSSVSSGSIELPDGLLGYVGSWVPGVNSVQFPAGTGVQLLPGAQLAVQVHYNLAAGTGKDRTAMSFQFDSSGKALKPLGLMGLIAPVEIPCPGAYPASPTDPCHRDAAYESVKKYQAQWLTNLLQSGALASYCRQQLPRVGETTNGTYITQCDFRVSKDVMAVSTQGHMHTRGQSVRIVVNPDSAKRFVALDIPRYDFHWQSSYYFEQPFKLSKGDVVRLTCTFDNTTATQPWVDGKQDKPKYVVWGESTQDEMCVGNLQTIPLEPN
jgi:hypothetical protein